MGKVEELRAERLHVVSCAISQVPGCLVWLRRYLVGLGACSGREVVHLNAHTERVGNVTAFHADEKINRGTPLRPPQRNVLRWARRTAHRGREVAPASERICRRDT